MPVSNMLGGGPMMGHNPGSGGSTYMPGQIYVRPEDEEGRKKLAAQQAAQQARLAAGRVNPGGAVSNQAQQSLYTANPSLAPQPAPTTGHNPGTGAADLQSFYTQNPQIAPPGGKPPATGGTGTYSTQTGQIVADRALNYLQGNDPQIKAAENRQQRDEARRLYAARIAAEEAMGQTHFQPGTVQYQRALDRSRAGAEAGNIDAREAFNAFVRGRTQDVENLGRDLEQEQYDRGQTDKKDTESRWTELLNALPDGPARYTALQMRNGGSSIADVTAAIFDPGAGAGTATGTIREQYRTPTDTASQRKTIEEQMAITNPELQPGTAEFNAEVNKKLKAWIEAQSGPSNDATKQKLIADGIEKMNRGDELTPDEIKVLQGADKLPRYNSVGELAKKGINQGYFNINNKVVRVLADKDNRQGYTVVVEVDGKKYLVAANGEWYEKTPEGSGKRIITPPVA